RGFQIICLLPLSPAAREDVDGAPSVAAAKPSAGVGIWRSRWLLRPVNLLRAAVFVIRTDGHHVAVRVQRHRVAELESGARIRSLDVGLLTPHTARSREHVHGAARHHRAVTLVSVDAFRVAVFAHSANGDCVAVLAERQRESELVAIAIALTRSWTLSGIR